MKFSLLLLLIGSSVYAAAPETNSDYDKPGSVHKRIANFYRTRSDRLPLILAEQDKTLQLGAYWLYLQDRHHSPLAEQQQSANNAKFLGMFMASTGLTPPDWWQLHFGGRYEGPDFMSVIHERESYYTQTYRNEARQIPPDKVLGEFELPPEMKVVDRNGDTVICTVDEDRVTINVKDFDHGSGRLFTVRVHHDCAYIAQHDDDLMDRIKLFKIDERGKVLWKQNLVASGAQIQIAGYVYPGRCQIEIVDGRIAVFGWSNFGPFVACVSDKDGSVNFHFSTHLASKW